MWCGLLSFCMSTQRQRVATYALRQMHPLEMWWILSPNDIPSSKSQQSNCKCVNIYFKLYFCLSCLFMLTWLRFFCLFVVAWHIWGSQCSIISIRPSLKTLVLNMNILSKTCSMVPSSVVERKGFFEYEYFSSEGLKCKHQEPHWKLTFLSLKMRPWKKGHLFSWSEKDAISLRNVC